MPVGYCGQTCGATFGPIVDFGLLRFGWQLGYGGTEGQFIASKLLQFFYYVNNQFGVFLTKEQLLEKT